MAPIRDQIISNAKSASDLVALARAADPDLAQQLTGKSLFSTKSPPVVVGTYVIMWLSTRYGIGLDEESAGIVTLAVGVVVTYAMRYITKAPIATLISKPIAPIDGPN